MSIRELQEYTYISRYARYNKAEKRRETWEEACDRVLQMHLKRYPQAKDELVWAFSRVKEKKVLGSQRTLQFGGSGVERNHARAYNCTGSYCDRLRFFQECFWLLLCGSGTGFSVQKHHIAKLPPFFHQSSVTKTYVIPDSIEGWADALGVLLSSYFEDAIFQEYANCNVEFDYSLIRPKGSNLSTSAGKAPGPDPLRRAIEFIRRLLDQCVSRGQTRLRPIDAYDIVMYSSDAVLSGGVRRSATIVLFSPDDEEMASAKIGNWFHENPQRARSNNSALLVRDKTTYTEFCDLIKKVIQWGEPGFFWSDSTEACTNPCCEVGFYPVDVTTGQTGWQACNLVEINGKAIKNKEDFRSACRAAAIIGTVQAGYTDFPYLGEVSERIIRREALIGVGLTGFMENPEVLLDPSTQREMAEYIKKVNEEIAALLEINVSARCTVVKPSGTTSCILGTSSGIHPHHSKRYFRHVQGNNMEPTLQYFAQVNPAAVEESLWSSNKTDSVVTFCIDVGDAKVKADFKAVELLEVVRSTQQNWVASGTRLETCTQPWLINNVSNTITVEPDEWEGVAKFIYDNRKYFAGISLLPSTGDKDYAQAPFCEVYTAEELEMMYGKEVLESAAELVETSKMCFTSVWQASDYALENIVLYSNHSMSMRMIWSEAFDTFASKWFTSKKEATYCLKDYFNYTKWQRLVSEYKAVDYTQLHEEEDVTKPMDTISCSGGSCNIF